MYDYDEDFDRLVPAAKDLLRKMDKVSEADLLSSLIAEHGTRRSARGVRSLRSLRLLFRPDQEGRGWHQINRNASYEYDEANMSDDSSDEEGDIEEQWPDEEMEEEEEK